MPATTCRLEALRKLMAERGLKAYYIPSEDAHQSEYIALWDARREYVSGFTGSAGFAIVTEKEAALWTDGRYFLQAEKQLDSNWRLMKNGLPGTPTKEEWLAKMMNSNDEVGVDAQIISFDAANKMKETLSRHDIRLRLMKENLIDLIWKERPSVDLEPVFLLPINYTGRESVDKIQSLRNYLDQGSYWGFLVTALDEVGWLFNLRGSDIPCNPNFFAYALVVASNVSMGEDDSTDIGEVRLYLRDSGRLQPEAKNCLQGVQILAYERIFDDLHKLSSAIRDSKRKLLISSTCNAALVEAIDGEDLVTSKVSPVEMEKAIKNETEIQGLRNCHIRDAAALIRYFAWLEEALSQGKTVDEVDGANQLEAFRREGKDFRGLSFDTISGAGPNGAIIHYKPEKPTAAHITANQMYLCDSGGQYLDGTTDVTRTLHFGTPTDEERDCYTRVLLGHIALDRAVFPLGTTGFMLDCLARTPLWSAGLDYRHGTGHGVGHFLNVHEGPQSISFHVRSNDVALKSGMTITNEPGVYLEGKFGVRIENVLVVREAELADRDGRNREIKFCRFENITMVPICKRLLARELMTTRDLEWIDGLHRKCWDLVSPLLEDDERALNWLKRETMPILSKG